MSVFQIDLAGFEFPRELPNNKANFRFVVDLRFTNESGQFATEHAVMPSLDTFWECDRGRSDKPNYVRGDDGTRAGESDRAYSFSRFDMARIDPWDRLVLRVKGTDVHAIQFKVFDVDRRDAWDKVKDVLKGIVETVIGKVKGFVSEEWPALVSDSLGGAADDVQSFLLKKLAGGDKVLFRGSTALRQPAAGGPGSVAHDIEGDGTRGGYRIDFRLDVESDAAVAAPGEE